MNRALYSFCALLLAVAAPLSAATFTSSASGNWSSSATWGGAGVPSTGDTAVISSGTTVTLDVTATVATLTISGGTLTGANGITVTSSMNFNGGTLSGTGSTSLQTGIPISVGNYSTIDTRPVTNNGTIAITSTYLLYLQNNAILTNNGTIDIQGDGGVYMNGAVGTTAVDNSGTIKKSSGTATGYMTVPLVAGSGSSLSVQSGTLDVGYVNSTGGGFSAASGATLLFGTSDTRTFDAASTISGAGTVNWGNGTDNVSGTYNVTGTTVNSGATTTITSPTSTGDINVSNGTLTLNGATAINVTNLTMQGGTLSGTLPINVTGASMTWTSGTIAGSGVLNISASTAVTVTSYENFDTRSITNSGTITYSGSAYSYFYNSASFTNNGTVDFQGDGGFYTASGSPTVVNSGTIKKSTGTGQGGFNIALTLQSGSQLLIQSGSMLLKDITATGATLNVSSGAVAWFYYTTTASFDAASTISGTGSVNWGSGTDSVSAAYSVSGTTTNSGATTTLSNITSISDIVVSSGTLTLNSASTLNVNTLTMQGGTLNGTAPISLAGSAMTWSGGTVGGSGALSIPAVATVTVTGITIDTRSVTNTGTIALTSNGTIYMANNAVLTNAGTIDMQSDGSILVSGTVGTISVVNNGTIKKSAGTSGSSFNVPLTMNSGSQLLVQSTTLYAGNIAASGATVSVASGATLWFYYTTTASFDAASTIAGAGTVNFGTGTETVSGNYNVTGTTKNTGATTTLSNITSVGDLLVNSGTLTLNTASTLSIPTLTMQGGTLNGTAPLSVTGTSMTWSGGTLSSSGLLTIPAATTVTITGITLSGQPVSNAGTFALTSNGATYLSNNAVLTNNGTIDLQSDAGVYLSGTAGTTALVNNGTVKKSAGTSGSSFSVPLTMNSGSQFLIQTSTVYFGNVTSSGATLSVASGATAYFYYTTTASFDAASTISGAGTVQFGAGTETVSGTYNISGATKNSATATLSNIISLGNVTVSGGTLTLNGATALSIPTLTMQGGTLNGTLPLNLTTAGTMTWSGGILSSSGTLTIGSGVTVNVTSIALSADAVTNSGTIALLSNGSMSLGNNAVLTNNGTLDLQTDGSVQLSTAVGTTAVINAGIIKKSGGTSGSTFNVPLTLQSGSQFLVQNTIVYLGDVTSTGGTLSAASGTTAWFYYTTTASFDAASTISGAGTVEWSAGTNTISATYNVTGATKATGGATTLSNVTAMGAVTIAGGTLTVNSASTITIPSLAMQGGTFNGTAPITIGVAAMTWSGGILGGSGMLTIPTGAVITLTSLSIDARPVTNAGTINITSNGAMNLGNNAVLTDSGTIDLQSDGSIGLSTAVGTTAVVVSGVLKKSAGTSGSTINVPLTIQSGGQLLVQVSTIYIGNVTSTGGAVSVASGALLYFYYTTTATFDAASTIGGAGTVQWGAGTDTFSGTITAACTVSGATLSINSAAAQTIPTLNISGGTFQGTAAINLTGTAMTWSGGTIGGTGTLTSPAGTTITVSNSFTVSSQPIVNNGTIAITNSNYIYIANNATITNGGTIDIQGDGGIYLNSAPGTTTVTNNGTIKKSGGTGVSQFSVNLVANSGSQFLVQSGTVYLGAITATSASFSVASGAILDLYYGNVRTFDAGSSIGGAGTVVVSNDSTTFSGTISTALTLNYGHFTLNSTTAQTVPTLTFGGGTFNGTGTLNVGGNSTWTNGTITGGTVAIPAGTTVSVNSFTLDTGTLSNAGTLALTTTSYLYVQNNAVLSNSGTIDIQSDGSIYLNSAAGTTSVINNGTIKKSGGTSVSYMNVPLTENSGSQFLAHSGTTYVGAVTSSGGTFNAATGATLDFYSSDARTFDSASAVSGTGTVTWNGGTSTFAGTLTAPTTINGGTLDVNSATTQTIPSLTMQSGFLGGTGSIHIGSGSVIPAMYAPPKHGRAVRPGGGSTPATGALLTGGTMTWSGGTINGSGALVITSGNTVDINGLVTIDGKPVTNSGILAFLANNYLYLQNGASIANGGTIDFQSDGSIYLNAGSATLTNDGTLTKSGGTGISYVYVPTTNSSTGTINAATATIQFTAGLTNAGTLYFPIAGASSFGKIGLNGAFPLGGTLTATTTGGYSPATGTAFQVLSYGSYSGSFSTTNLDYATGTFTPTYASTALTLTAGPQALGITGVSPNLGTDAGGTTVTISGVDFQSGATVTFGGTAATVTYVNSTTLTAVTPAHPAGPADVVVTNPSTQTATRSSGYLFTGLVSHYSFDDSVNGPGKDVAGTNNATNVVGVTEVTGGKVGQAGSFSSGYMDLPAAANLNLRSSDFTLDAFVNANTPTNANWFTKATATAQQYGLSANGAQAVFSFDGGSGGSISSVSNVFDGTWHHVAAVKRGTSAEIWVDGKLEASGTISGTNDGGAFAIGRDGQCCDSFNGEIDEAKIYNYALSATQIATDAQATDLAIAKSGPASVTAGQTITWTITVTNNGPTTATSVGVSDTLPSGTSLVSATASQGTCSGSFAISCNLGSILNAGTATVTIVANATTAGSVTNTATVSSAVPDTNTANNSASAVTIINAPTCSTPTATANGPTTFCQGGSVTLTASAGSSYSWSNGATTQSIVVTTSGNYSVTVTYPNTCSATSTATTVTVNTPPPTPVITASGPTTFCQGGSVTLTAPAGTTYAWSNGATTQSISVNATGNFTVTVSNASGCSATSAPMSVTVNPLPSATITAPSSACANVSTSASAPANAGANFAWTATNATIDSGNGTNAITFTPNGAGTAALSLTVTDTNGCTANGTANVTVGSITPAITASGPSTFCQGGSVTLTASAGAAYHWSNSATTQSITVNTSGTYSVTVSSGSCSGTSAPFTVTVNPNPTAMITANGSTSFCQGGSVTLAASSGASWHWSNGATTQTIAASTSGNFSVTVTDAQGCSATSSPVTVTVSPNPAPAITGPASACTGSAVTLDAGAGFAAYVWTTGDTTQTITVTPSASSTYGVTVTNNFGCSASTSHTVTVSNTPVASVTVPASVCPASTGNAASTAATAGATYAWTITGGTITAGQSTSAITFTAGASGNVQLGVTVTSGTCNATGSASVPISATSGKVTIMSPGSVPSSSSGNHASVAAGPPGTTYAWTISGGTITAGQGTPSITWTAGSGSFATIDVTVTTSGCSATGTTTIAIAGTADLSISISGPASVNTGAPFAYVLTVNDAGPGAAQNVTVNDTVPSGVTVGSASGSGWNCAASGNTVTCTAASVVPGNATPITISATAPSSAGAITDGASVSATTTDPNGANNNATFTTQVTAPAPQCPTTAPSLAAPADGASLPSPVAFSWSSVASATAYDLWVNGTIATTVTGTSATLSLPAGAATWMVAAEFGNNCPPAFSASRSFTVTQAANCQHGAAQLTAPPAGGTVASPVTLQWTAVAEAVNYRVWVAIDGGAPQDIGMTGGAISFTTPLTGTNVSWYVESLFNGCSSTMSQSSTFTLQSINRCANHGSATLTAPADKSTVSSSSVQFQWTTVTNANGYRVWAKVNGGDFATLGETTSDSSLASTIAAGSVEWYVQTLFDGCPSTESAHATFTVPPAQNCPTAAASIVSPSNGSTLTSTSVQFSWNAAPNAIGYEVWLSFSAAAPTLLGTTTAGTFTHDVPAGALEWFVRANFNGCASLDSAHATFTVAPPPSCPQQRPLLIAPADDDHVVSPADFSWSAVPQATQYQVWLAKGNGTPSALGTTTANHLDAQTLQPGSYAWFVEADFGGGCSPMQSAGGTFVVLSPPAACDPPVPPMPRADSQVSSGIGYVIAWNRIGNAAFYEYEESLSPSFTDASPIVTNATRVPFQHMNSGAAPVAYYYRVRMVSQCDSARSLFSPTVVVIILPAVQSGPEANGSTPADNPQNVTYTFNVPAQPGQAFSATANETWLTVTPSTGTATSSPITLTVTANTAGLTLGTNTGAITVVLGSISEKRAVTSSSTTTVNVSLVSPSSPTTKSAPPPDALIIPAVAHADGINSKFQSDIRVTNTAPDVKKYQLTFTPTGDAGFASGKQATITVSPGGTIALDDILSSWFGTSGAIGTLEIRPSAAASNAVSPSSKTSSSGVPSITTFASSRTYDTTPNGTFGQYIPAIPFSQFVGSRDSVLTLQQIAQSQAYRTNFGLVEGAGEPATVLISIFGDDGSKVAEFSQALNGGQHLQMNGILAAHNLSMNDGRIEVRVTSTTGKVTAYASVVDNATNDPLLVSPVQVNSLGAMKWVIPGVADLNSGAANWRSDVRLFNAGANTVNATLTYIPQGDGTSITKTVAIAPNEVKQLDGILQSVFGVTNSGGALQITTGDNAPLVATARTYNRTANGTYGQFIPAVTPDDAVGKGDRALQILQVEESDRYRSNVGIAEVTGNAATVEISAVPPDSKTAVSTQTTLKPNEFRQYGSLLRSLGLGDTYNARVTVRVIDGDGKVTAYASVIDQKTQDPTFVPAQ